MGKEEGCSSIVLTSAFPRIDAHRFYEREGFDKVSYSFVKSYNTKQVPCVKIYGTYFFFRFELGTGLAI